MRANKCAFLGAHNAQEGEANKEGGDPFRFILITSGMLFVLLSISNNPPSLYSPSTQHRCENRLGLDGSYLMDSPMQSSSQKQKVECSFSVFCTLGVAGQVIIHQARDASPSQPRPRKRLIHNLNTSF